MPRRFARRSTHWTTSSRTVRDTLRPLRIYWGASRMQTSMCHQRKQGPWKHLCGGTRRNFASTIRISSRYESPTNGIFPEYGGIDVIRWLLVVSLALAATPGAAQWALTVVAPASLEPAAQRIRNLDAQPLADALQRAGLALPPRVHVTLIPENDSRASNMPAWFVGFASGAGDIIIFPDRVSSYPYDSLESVMRHEVVHLALNARADGRPLPRWFHEGVAVLIESGWGLGDRFRLTVAGFSGPPLDDVTQLFASDARPDTTQAYLLAAALVDELRRMHGATLPGRIAAHVATGMPFGRAFEIETGETPALAAARAWRSYRRWTSWLPLATSASAVWGLILVLAFAAFFTRLLRRAHRRRQSDDGDV